VVEFVYGNSSSRSKMIEPICKVTNMNNSATRAGRRLVKRQKNSVFGCGGAYHFLERLEEAGLNIIIWRYGVSML
jgi:hypothetical protein